MVTVSGAATGARKSNKAVVKFAAALVLLGLFVLSRQYQAQAPAVWLTTFAENDIAGSNAAKEPATVSASSQTKLGDLTIPIHEDLCPESKRFGVADAEGGWLVCDPASLKNKGCVVYSFGIKDDYSFDKAMHDELVCEVHGFDPSSYGLESKEKYEALGDKIHYHAVGLGIADGKVEPGFAPFRWPGIGYLKDTNTEPWVLQRVPTIMKDLGHNHLSFLKIDAEGAEWDAIDDIIKAKWGEFAAELHFPPKEYEIEYHYNLNKDVTSLTITRHEGYKMEEPAVPKWLDRVPLMRKLLAVADVWQIEPNPGDKNCMNVYFKKKRT